MLRLDAWRTACLAAVVGAVAFAPRPAAAQPVLSLGDVVVTGFSGTVAPDPANPFPAGKTAVDLTFIDTAAASARILGVSNADAAFDAHVVAPAKILDVPAADVGQVFGVAIDDAEFPDVYLAATSAFGLNIVIPGRTSGALPERSQMGRARAVWMKGQFGLDLQGGPGNIWRVDGATGEVSLFANVTLDGVPNPGPALGGMAYDSAHKQLFVSDLYTGMIHRFDLEGTDLGHFDHGADARPLAGLAPVPFDGSNRLDITSPAFNSSDPTTWGYAPDARRVWGLAVHDGRLFYSVAEGPQVWSVGIADDGSFAGDARWELDVANELGPFPVSDIAFSNAGAMILAQRATLTASYDYSAFTLPGEPRVLVYWLENPDDPATPSKWMAVPEEYAIGFSNNSRGANGGVDLGYAYGADGRLDTTGCEASLWTTGDKLRNDPSLADRLLPGGALLIDGLQASPADQVREANTPPWLSYFIDYDDQFDDMTAAGHMGGVRVLKAPCSGGVTYGGPPPIVHDGGGCKGPNCPPPPEKACFASKGSFECNPATGQWIYKLSVDGPAWLNAVTALSLTPGVSVPGGVAPLNPASIPVTGTPGSSAIIEVCAFDAAAAASGTPYDCCRTKIKVTIPNQACGIVK